MIKNLGMVYLHGQLVMFIRAIINLIQEMALVKCIGMMVATIKVNGKMVSNMEMDKFMYLAKVLKKAYLKIMF
jgi:hypothetical protein